MNRSLLSCLRSARYGANQIRMPLRTYCCNSRGPLWFASLFKFRAAAKGAGDRAPALPSFFLIQAPDRTDA
jgi:hypothetical protein